jgi:hypothetical protein
MKAGISYAWAKDARLDGSLGAYWSSVSRGLSSQIKCHRMGWGDVTLTSQCFWYSSRFIFLRYIMKPSSRTPSPVVHTDSCGPTVVAAAAAVSAQPCARRRQRHHRAGVVTRPPGPAAYQ